ncbi:hypothetical protein TCAL_05211 [Tigriopus californicus]|uniref:Fibroblast growth factor n=1 Tax=Tigriopus californicus TaxID=6832 RepID=A0A553NWY3_TIGCA|nr:uncharacterized protein LOC131886660 [Tigriopus californicus]TRY69946.1 hypothetical protein TCAL_05211 [Tigriopus californicus]
MPCGDLCDWLLDLVFKYEQENTMVDFIASDDGEVRIRDGNSPNDKMRDSPRRTRGNVDHVPYTRNQLKQLYNRHGFNLAIFRNGRVRGVLEAFNPNAVVAVMSVAMGEVQILGVESGNYLAMTEDGKLFGEPDPTQTSTVFYVQTHASYLTYLSKKYSHMGWHVGIKKNGEVKNGKMTLHPWGQRAILFSLRKPFVEHHPVRLIKNRHGFYLAIFKDGTVKGTKDENDPHSVLEFTSSDPPGAFRIHGVEADLYVAMDEKGRVYGEKNRQHEGTLFQEHAQGVYFVYLNVHSAHLGWHLGIKKSGKVKNGKKTWNPSSQKAIQFSHKFSFQTTRPIDQGFPFGEKIPPLAFIDEDVVDRDH